MGQTATGHFDGAGTGVDPAGALRTLRVAGAPVAGTDEVQTLTFGGTGAGTFRLSIYSLITAEITWSSTNATLVSNIDTALEAILGTGTVTTAVGTMTNGIGTITVTFTGDYAKKAVPTMTVYSKSDAGMTLTIAETTPGVDATYRNAPLGQPIIDTTNKIHYINTGTTVGAPTWTKTGTQV